MPHTHTAPSRRPAVGAWRLHPGHAMALRPKQPAVLRIVCGQVWATQDQPAGATPHSAGDHFLGPGDVLMVPAGVRLVLEPLAMRGDTAPVHFDWSDACALAASTRFDREVLQPTRELGVALGQAATATARVLRGLLSYRECLLAGRVRVLTPLEPLRS